jgi:hypothetical protein
MSMERTVGQHAISTEVQNHMRYGVNESDSWWYFALGPQRERIWARLRALNTRIIRVFLFDKHAPDPVANWHDFAAYIQAVLNVGAIPFITFAKFRRPFDDARAVRWFANQCADVVWGCIEQWGGEVVRNWYWCIWNEPNNDWIGGGINFEQYRRVYEAVAEGIVRWLGPYLDGCRPRIGGPAVEGFDPFWMDWVWRFVHEIDRALVGFINWHYYTEWRDHGEQGAPGDAAVHRALILSQTPEYAYRGQAIARLSAGTGIQNICGEWNSHSHAWPQVRARFNQSLFGAVYGASALLHLLRSGVDAEMLWTGTDEACGYGVLDKDARPTPLYHSKRLCTQYLRDGDWVSFPMLPDELREQLEVGIARGEDGQLSTLIVHLQDEPATYHVAQLHGALSQCSTLLKLDRGTDHQIIDVPFDGTVSFQGYGVAVVTNASAGQSSEKQ